MAADDKPDYCHESNDRKHVPDYYSIVKADIAGDDHWILDVSCKACGRSGAFRVDPKTEIDW